MVQPPSTFRSKTPLMGGGNTSRWAVIPRGRVLGVCILGCHF
jgi:hypothetical protein